MQAEDVEDVEDVETHLRYVSHITFLVLCSVKIDTGCAEWRYQETLKI